MDLPAGGTTYTVWDDEDDEDVGVGEDKAVIA
jgi:hypothetical protein